MAVAVEIMPEPSDEERQAILRTLELERGEADEPTPWRRAGLVEGPDGRRDAGQAGAPPRQSLGATRA